MPFPKRNCANHSSANTVVLGPDFIVCVSFSVSVGVSVGICVAVSVSVAVLDFIAAAAVVVE